MCPFFKGQELGKQLLDLNVLQSAYQSQAIYGKLNILAFGIASGAADSCNIDVLNWLTMTEIYKDEHFKKTFFNIVSVAAARNNKRLVLDWVKHNRCIEMPAIIITGAKC